MLALKIEADELAQNKVVAIEKIEVNEEGEKKSEVSDEFEALLIEFGEFQKQCVKFEDKVKREAEKWKIMLMNEVDEADEVDEVDEENANAKKSMRTKKRAHDSILIWLEMR